MCLISETYAARLGNTINHMFLVVTPGMALVRLQQGLIMG